MIHQNSKIFMIFGLVSIFLNLSACSKTPGPNPTYTQPSDTPEVIRTPSQTFIANSSTPKVPTRTATITFTPTLSPTVTPTNTPVYPTPTFDPATITTVTKSPNAACPKTDPSISPIFQDQGGVTGGNYPDDQITLQKTIQEALDQGATLSAIQAALTKATGNGEPLEIKPNVLFLKELTGDNVPEVIFDSGYRYSIFTCKNGHYLTGLDIPTNFLYWVKNKTYQDLNRDHQPEIIIHVQNNVAVGASFHIAIFRWDGSTFQNLIASEDTVLSEFSDIRAQTFEFHDAYQYQIIDLDRNGTLELVIREEFIGTHAEAPLYGPWRMVTDVISWNGAQFVLLPPKFDPPVYRFQAIQDGDRALYRGDYDEALRFYDQALNDRNLKGWSKAHFEHMQTSIMAGWAGTPTPTALPDDPTECPTLAAYARFHILLIHAIQGNFDQAFSEYQSLQKDYSSGQPGYAFVELAKVFWETYEKTGNLGAACGKARTYAKSHPNEITNQLDFTWHGNQSPGMEGYRSIDIENYICPVE